MLHRLHIDLAQAAADSRLNVGDALLVLPAHTFRKKVRLTVIRDAFAGFPQVFEFSIALRKPLLVFGPVLRRGLEASPCPSPEPSPDPFAFGLREGLAKADRGASLLKFNLDAESGYNK